MNRFPVSKESLEEEKGRVQELLGTWWTRTRKYKVDLPLPVGGNAFCNFYVLVLSIGSTGSVRGSCFSSWCRILTRNVWEGSAWEGS